MQIKSTTTTEGIKKEKKGKKSKSIYRTSQNIRTINAFLESLLSVLSLVGSHSPPPFPRTPSNTVLISGPVVGAAQILICSYSPVFLPPMSTAIRTSAFSFVGALSDILFFLIFIFFISWRLITLQYCSGFCHTLTWISHGFTCIPHPDPPSHLPPHPIPLGLPSAPAPSTCLMHPAWAGDLFHSR